MVRMCRTETNSKSTPERPYEINIRKTKNQLYSTNYFKNDKIKKTNDQFLDSNQNTVKMKDIKKEFLDLLKIKKKHLKFYD